jgi:TPR repeat protein
MGFKTHEAAHQNLLKQMRSAQPICVPQDDAEALKWWRKAAEQGDATAQTNLGFMYDSFMYDIGRGVPQDDAEALKWYRKAAEQGE